MRKLAVTLFSILLILPARLFAQSASVNTFLPAIDDSRYLTVYGSQTLQPWQFRTGFYLNYARNPLEIGLAVRRAGLINNLVAGDFFGSVGLTDWMEVGLDMPVVLWGDGNNFITGQDRSFTVLGDVRFETKFRLMDADRYGVGVAILPYVLIPTGSGNLMGVDPVVSDIGRVGAGNDSFAGGGTLIADVDIYHRVQLSANFGYLARKKVTVFNADLGSQFTYGVGFSGMPVSWFHVIAEIKGSTVLADFFQKENENPLEFDAGVRYLPPQMEGLQVTAGGGAGLTFGYGAPNLRLLLGLSYMKPGKFALPAPPALPPEEVLAFVDRERINIAKKIHFEFNKAIIRPISFPILNAVVDLLNENPQIRKVRIEGHTDFIGSDEYNLRLSDRRAHAVLDYLVKHGVSNKRLVAQGFGESRPVATNETVEGRARNRRVEFIILEQGYLQP